MTNKTKRHYDKVLSLLEKNRLKYGYGTIAPVDACIGDGDCLFFDFGADYEVEMGRKLSGKEVQRRLYYILSLLADDGKIESHKTSFYFGQVRLYAFKLQQKIK